MYVTRGRSKSRVEAKLCLDMLKTDLQHVTLILIRPFVVGSQLKETHEWKKQGGSHLSYYNTNHVSPAVPSGVYYSRWVSDCLGETIKVITLFMRTDFQSGKCSRVTFLLSTIQPFKCWVIIAAHLKRLFSFSLSRCSLSILDPSFNSAWLRKLENRE